MEENRKNNYVLLRGAVSEAPRFSHESRDERFYQFSMEISRLSGTVDPVHIIARQPLLESLSLADSQGKQLCVCGELRSFNNKSGVGPKLVITVYAMELWLCEDKGEDENLVELRGALCKAPNLRTTPMGREICDLMLAVNRRYGRSDYLPCIAWGLSAREAAGWNVGDTVRLTGRIQSRNYTKVIDGDSVVKTAFEVSVIGIEKDADSSCVRVKPFQRDIQSVSHKDDDAADIEPEHHEGQAGDRAVDQGILGGHADDA